MIQTEPSVLANSRTYRMLETTFGVATDDAGCAELLDHLLAPFVVDPAPNQKEDRYRVDHTTHADFQLRVGEELLAQSSSLAEIVTVLVAELNRKAVETVPALAVHAGVVARGERVIAFPAGSGGGKSTLTAACLRTGFRYVSDEALCLAFPDGSVIPYPKPLGLSPESRRLLRMASGDATLSYQDLGAGLARIPLELSDLVLPERHPGEMLLEELPRSEVVSSLLRWSFNHYRWPQDSYRLATRLARTTRTWRLAYEDPLEAARLLWEELV